MKLSRAVLAALCGSILALGVGAGLAQAAPDDPLSVFTPPPSVPPGTGFEGPCGVAVDKNGTFYVSDYYHGVVDVFTQARGFLTQLGGLDPIDGPCGLAVDSGGTLYVNEYHRNVTRYDPAAFPIALKTGYEPGVVIDSSHPTGVAVDSATNYLYVNRRDRIAIYDPSGIPVAPFSVGTGNLVDGYGVAVSRYPSTAGYVYVPDAANDTVRVYDPAINPLSPAQVIAGPPGGFHSLRDAAIAVDRVTGDVYVADGLHPEVADRPEATIQVFSSAGAYKGHLKFNVIDARPVGLAVDNSSGSSQGRVYVTSGNTEGAVLYAYGPGAATTASPICAPGGACPAQGGGAQSGLSAPTSIAGATSQSEGTPANDPPAAQVSEITQKGSLRVTVSGKLSPRSLPRKGQAPISVSVGGKISTTDESAPPQLKTMRIEINRHGHLDSTGLPTCPYRRIQPASSQRALSACRSALVGKGSFEATISLSGQEPYPTKGKLLLFNGRSHGKQVLYGQIYSPRPFATSFVIVFAVRELRGATYGTALTASLPKALGSWGNLTGIEITLSRRYSYGGERRSYISAGCPAPPGFRGALFPLARASFGFEGGKELSSVFTETCKVKG